MRKLLLFRRVLLLLKRDLTTKCQPQTEKMPSLAQARTSVLMKRLSKPQRILPRLRRLTKSQRLLQILMDHGRFQDTKQFNLATVIMVTITITQESKPLLIQSATLLDAHNIFSLKLINQRIIQRTTQYLTLEWTGLPPEILPISQ